MSGRKTEKGSRGRSTLEAPAAPPQEDLDLTQGGASGDGAGEETSEGQTSLQTEEPAQVELKIKGSDKSARAAAKRFGEGAAARPAAVPAISTPADDPEPPDEDPIATLLADGKNMVIVTRQTPRNIRGLRGEKIVTNVRLPGKYTCPTSIAAIEEQVFGEHWGAVYKCTIHPDTSTGENQILGHFKIEHPDPKAPPYVEGVTDVQEEQEQERELPTRGDPTMQETDTLVDLRENLKRQLERANTMKEIQETKRLIKQINEDIEGRPDRPPVAAPAESDEVRKLREENAKLTAALTEKKVNDRFDKLENSITELANALKNGNGAKSGAATEESFMMQMMKQTQQHSKDMIELIKGSPKSGGGSEDFDKMLDRLTKLQTITGGGPSKGSRGLSSLEEKLIDMSFDRLTSGGGGDDDDVDDVEGAVKLAIKQFAPIAKTYVEKRMDQENQASGGAPLSQDQVKKIYAEAAQAAAKKVQDDLALQGLQLSQTTDGRLIALPATKGGKSTVPPRSAGTKVMSETRTAGGVVKKISIKPDDLSGKPKPPSAEEAPESQPAAEPTKGETVPKAGVFPMLGPNGSTINIEFPIRPGELKYDRKYSVNFILDGIRSEIRQGLPQKAQTDAKIESYVIGDAIEYLDEEILNSILDVDDGNKLETLLAPSGDAEKIAEIKKSGEDEVIASYLRKLVLSIQREWQRENAK